jgi:nitrite reductase/ring-hydroxylating ferredoxin subunit
MGGGQVICPLHSHKFDLQEGEGAEPGECLTVFVVEERKGEILLRVDSGRKAC